MIRKVKWNNYKSLGNLELNFVNPSTGLPFNTIVLAGENGTGKTTILESLATFLNRQSIRPFEYIEYSVDGNSYCITPDNREEWFVNSGFHNRRLIESSAVEMVHTGISSNEEKIHKDLKDLRHYGFSYSKARSGFKTDPVRSVTTQQIDNEKYEPDEEENFTRIIQLLIDIDGQDSSDWMRLCQERGINDDKFDDFKKLSKGYRFEKAFNDFFTFVKYKGIDNSDPSEKKVLFEKYGKSIPVDQLSTGEKQIVFRGAHLLRNINSISGGIVLIDEPELSMHPIWQKRILDFYRGLFKNDGNQSVQMIIATHSEYVIQSALKDRDNVLVIVLSDENGKINAREITAPNVLPSVTAAETNYLAFGVPSIDYHIELYGYLQTKTGCHRIEDCDSCIASQPQYDAAKHQRIDSYRSSNYQTLPTYIRNAIDHPDSGRTYTEEEFEESIKLLIELCK